MIMTKCSLCYKEIEGENNTLYKQTEQKFYVVCKTCYDNAPNEEKY